MSRPRLLFPLLLLTVLAASRPAHAWGPAMHAYVNYTAREHARMMGTDWRGLDLRAYITGAPAPDLWYAAEEAKLTVPGAIEEDWEYVRLLFAESKNIRQASFALGYAGHIVGDVRGHQVYLAASTGNAINHLVRDTSSGFVLFGAFEGYTHYQMPLDLVIGWGLDTVRGTGTGAGEWKNRNFDEEIVSLMKRAADKWCTERAQKEGKAIKGCPVTPETIRKLRDFYSFAVNTVAHSLSFPGYYADQSTAAANAKMVKGFDDTEWGVGKGPEMLNKGLVESVSQSVTRLYFTADIRTWMERSGLTAADQARFFIGPPPPDQTEKEGAATGEALDEGCAVASGEGDDAAWWALLALLIMLRRRR